MKCIKDSRMENVNDILNEITVSIREAGYSPKQQLTAYLFLGDPKYITRHNDAREKIKKLRPYEIENYLNKIL